MTTETKIETAPDISPLPEDWAEELAKEIADAIFDRSGTGWDEIRTMNAGSWFWKLKDMEERIRADERQKCSDVESCLESERRFFTDMLPVIFYPDGGSRFRLAKACELVSLRGGVK